MNLSVIATGHDVATTIQSLFGAMRRISPPGFSLTAASTLGTLELHGPQRLTELAAREGVTQPAMTQLVSRLERDALAARVADPMDGRVVLVEITPAGRDLLKHRRLSRTNKIEEALASMPAADRRAIENAMPALARLAEAL